MNLIPSISVTVFLLFQTFAIPRDRQDGVTEVPGVETKNVTAQYCPHPCTVGNASVCGPVPCPPPPCLNPAYHKPTDCCNYCPDGPNCRAPDGSFVKYGHWKIIDGKNCTCKYMTQNTICTKY